MRTVGFLLAEGGINPTTPQYAGVQGEHNATEVLFTLPDVWVEQGYAVRAEFVDGVGAFDTTGFLPISGNLVTVPLPTAWTSAGGMGEIRLAAAQLDEMGLPEQQVVYSAVGYLYFDSREGGNAAAREELEQGLSALIADTERATANADKAAAELRQAAVNGEFTGDKGDKGDKGENGKDGEAIMPISYVHPRLSGGAPNYRYTYEIYTPWETAPDSFLFSVQLVYGLESGDGWGIEFMGANSWTATEDNFDGWNIGAGTHLFSYANGQVTHIKGEKGEKGDKGDTGAAGPQGEKGDPGSLTQVVLYENASGLEGTSYSGIATNDDIDNYNYLIIDTNHGTFPVYKCEKQSGYWTGGTVASAGGGGFYVSSVCIQKRADGVVGVYVYENAYFYVMSSGSPTWPTTSTKNKLYRITGVKL